MGSANGRLVFTCACERRPSRNIGGTGLPTRPFPWRCRMIRHVSSPRERSYRSPWPCRTDRMPSGAAALTQRGTEGGQAPTPRRGRKPPGWRRRSQRGHEIRSVLNHGTLRNWAGRRGTGPRPGASGKAVSLLLSNGHQFARLSSRCHPFRSTAAGCLRFDSLKFELGQARIQRQHTVVARNATPGHHLAHC